jgi:hypothetical protein
MPYLEKFESSAFVLLVSARVGADCYSVDLRRNRADTGTITGILELVKGWELEEFTRIDANGREQERDEGPI